jgi:4-hydroxy-tetrahydrodipicolinate synthase
VELIYELRLQHPNFKYFKVEEPLCTPKFEAIIKATEGQVEVFEGGGEN